METVRVAPAPAAVAVQKMKLLEPRKEPLASAAAAAAKAPCKWVMKKKLVGGDAGYVLEDVPHLTDYMPELPGLHGVPPDLLEAHPKGEVRGSTDGDLEGSAQPSAQEEKSRTVRTPKAEALQAQILT
ncbi:6-phosphofructokinase 3 [Hordeum vulgare]|nr:6-phosphofructokinase 3 [Hordeum vulgare]